MKQIGNTVLASKYTAYAADTLDGALQVADKYVDRYLPDDNDHGIDGKILINFLSLNYEDSTVAILAIKYFVIALLI